MPHALLVEKDELPLYGMDVGFTDQFESDTLDAILQAVTDECVGRMAPAVAPPLVNWGSDIRMKCAAIAVYELKSLLGLAPAGAAPGDENVIIRAQEARAWFDAVGDGEITPADPFEDSSGSDSGGAIIEAVSDEPRGW